MLVLRSSVLFHGWTVKVTARVRYLRSTTETERKPAQGTNDVLKLCQPTLCLDPRQLTASLSLKNPTQADRVIMLIIFIMLIMRIMVMFMIMRIMLIIRIMVIMHIMLIML